MKTYIVDSFTDQPFKGNPAGVCILKKEIKDELMLSIAQEIGLSETAFIKKISTENNYSIRFFSPKMEIPLCGHATLAASKVIFESFDTTEIHFINVQNIDLHIKREEHEIIMEFPMYSTSSMNAPEKLLTALGISEIINSEYNNETKILLIEIKCTTELRELTPDFNALYNSIDHINGVLVTAKSGNDGYDFHSRYFWPWSGTNEDPVTGGTHTFLTPYWSKRLGKSKMRSFQSSNRTGFMEVEIIRDDLFTIRSEAQIILEGELKV